MHRICRRPDQSGSLMNALGSDAISLVAASRGDQCMQPLHSLRVTSSRVFELKAKCTTFSQLGSVKVSQAIHGHSLHSAS
jgi:hypothetical protein